MRFDYPGGAVWRKWDLHAHTPLDNEWVNRPDLSTMTARESFAAEYVAEAINQKLAVVAITDHNFCDQLDNLLIPFIQKEALKKGLVVLPGFEVTVSDCGGIHLLIVFSEDTKLFIIDDIVKQLFPPGTERFRNGMVASSVKTANELFDILKQSQLQYVMLFAHVDRENGALHQAPGHNRVMLWQSPFINIAQISKNPNMLTGFYSDIFKGNNIDYRRNMTYIVASDCRQLYRDNSNNARFALGERFTWIKADPTFEGLRQIIFEPFGRVKIQDHEPDTKSDYLIISSVRFHDDNLRFSPETIPINPALTCIVGGKSTGKSILLSMIANAIDREEFEQKRQVSGINIYDFSDLDLEVTWKDGTIDKLSAPSENHKITFIPQMYIHKLVEDKNRSSLSENILTFLRQNEEFNTKYSNLCNDIETCTNKIQSCVIALLNLLSRWNDVNKRLHELGDHSAVKSEYEKIADRLKALRASSNFTAEENQKYASLLDQNKIFNKRISDLKQQNSVFSDLQASITEAFQCITDRITPIEEDGSIPLINELSSRYEYIDDEINKITEIIIELNKGIRESLILFQQKVEETLNTNKNIRIEVEQQINSLNLFIKPFNDKISNQKELTELQEKIKTAQQTLDSIQLQGKEKLSLEKQYFDKLSELKQLAESHLSYKKKLSLLFGEPMFSNVGDEISIIVKMQFDNQHFKDNFLDLFDRRSSLNRLGVEFKDDNLVWSEETHTSTIFKILDTLLNTPPQKLQLHSSRTKEDAIQALFKDYLIHAFSVQQHNEDIFKMSPGKQGLILLELFLHLSGASYPILIDQPEDNLDNRTIFTHLVAFLRKKKIQRQIIIVTHNPNLVVGTDAEEIIVANQDGEGLGENEKFKFEYVSGSLECSFTSSDAKSILKKQGIREHVCQVLEGGAEAFKQREKKYNLLNSKP